MSCILVTGVNGFVGRSLCLQLTQRGFSVRGALRCCSSEELDLPDKIVIGDIGSDTRWEEALRGVDCVIHLAARVHVMSDAAADPLAAFRQVNRDGTVCLAEQAALSGVRRFIYLSSIKVNGEETKGSPYTAADLCRPADPYAVSKCEAEQALWELSRNTGMEVVIVRPPLVYGPGVKANFYKMMRVLARGIPLPLGAINNKRSLVAMDNLVDLVITCVRHHAAANQVFLAGDGEDLSTTELLRRLGAALGRPARLLPVPQRVLEFALKMAGKGDMAQRLCGSLQVDISKAKDVLGWCPPVRVDKGVWRAAEWYLREKL